MPPAARKKKSVQKPSAKRSNSPIRASATGSPAAAAAKGTASGSRLCILCGNSTLITHQGKKETPYKISASGIQSLCTVLNLKDNLTEAKVFFGQNNSYCHRCIGLINHCDSLITMLQIEREYISGLMLATYGELGFLGFGSASNSQTETTPSPANRSRRSTAALRRNYANLLSGEGDEDEDNGDPDYEEAEKKIPLKRSKVETVAPPEDQDEHDALFESFASFPDPVIVYDDEGQHEEDGEDFEVDVEGGEEFGFDDNGSIPESPNRRKSINRRSQHGTFLCPEPNCPHRYTRRSHLKTHLLSKHPDSQHLSDSDRGQIIEHKCYVANCTKIYREHSYLLYHIQKCHPDESKEVMQNLLSCQICGQGYKSQREVRSHSTIHDPLVTKICIFCNFGFKRTDKYNNHMRRYHSPNFDPIDGKSKGARETEEADQNEEN